MKTIAKMTFSANFHTFSAKLTQDENVDVLCRHKISHRKNEIEGKQSGRGTNRDEMTDTTGLIIIISRIMFVALIAWFVWICYVTFVAFIRKNNKHEKDILIKSMAQSFKCVLIVNLFASNAVVFF